MRGHEERPAATNRVTVRSYAAMTGSRTWALAETTADFDCGKTKTTLSLRQIHKRGADGAHYPLVTSRTDLAAAELVWRLGRRWRYENYFRYSRAHFALDTLDGYTDKPDDLTQPVPNPAKTDTAAAVAAAEHQLADAETVLAAAVPAAARAAGRPDNHGSVTVDHARTRLDTARVTRAATPKAGPARTGSAERVAARRGNQTDHRRHPHRRLQRRNHPRPPATRTLRPRRPGSPRPAPRSHAPTRRQASSSYLTMLVVQSM